MKFYHIPGVFQVPFIGHLVCLVECIVIIVMTLHVNFLDDNGVTFQLNEWGN